MNKIISSFFKLPIEEQKAIIEASIFSAEESVSMSSLFNTLILNDLPQHSNNYKDLITDQSSINTEIQNNMEYVTNLLETLIIEINRELAETGRPFGIVKIAGGYQYAVRPEFGEMLQKFTKNRNKKKLSQASLEVLAIIAYKQPVSKPEIEQIRGVNSNEIVNSLIEKNLINIAGRSDGLGKPLLYATTVDFLITFGLNSLSELPKLKELDELSFSDNPEIDKSDYIISPEQGIEELSESALSAFGIYITDSLKKEDFKNN
jgi:segregation and condensation protein B